MSQDVSNAARWRPVSAQKMHHEGRFRRSQTWNSVMCAAPPAFSMSSAFSNVASPYGRPCHCARRECKHQSWVPGRALTGAHSCKSTLSSPRAVHGRTEPWCHRHASR